MSSDSIEHIGLVGGGLMGAGIAQSALLAGFKVTLYDISDEAISSTKEQIEIGPYGFDQGVLSGFFSAKAAQQARKYFHSSVDISSLKDCDLIIESIPEKLDMKQEIFHLLEDTVESHCILASNTSGFPIADIAAKLSNKNRLIGLHFFAPANITTGVELIHHQGSSPDVIDRATEFCLKIGKTALPVKDKLNSYGFAANRVYLAMATEALKVVEEGIISQNDLNELFRRSYGWPAGPIEKGYPFSKEGIDEVTRMRAHQVGWKSR